MFHLIKKVLAENKLKLAIATADFCEDDFQKAKQHTDVVRALLNYVKSYINIHSAECDFGCALPQRRQRGPASSFRTPPEVELKPFFN